MINFAGFFYIFGSIIIACITYRLWHSYQKSKNPVTKDFTYIALSVVISLFVLGLSSLVFSQNYRIFKVGHLIGLTFLFISCAFGLRIFFYSKLEQIPPNFAFLIATFLGSVMLFLQARYTGHPRVVQGIVEWNLHPTVFLLLSALILGYVIPLTIAFIHSGLKDPKIRARSFGMASGFFTTGIGSILNTSNFGRSMIVLGAIFMSLGFISFAFVFFLTKPILSKL